MTEIIILLENKDVILLQTLSVSQSVLEPNQTLVL